MILCHLSLLCGANVWNGLHYPLLEDLRPGSPGGKLPWIEPQARLGVLLVDPKPGYSEF